MMTLIDYNSETIIFKDRKAYLIKKTDGKEDHEIFKGCLMIPEANLTPEQIRVLDDIPSPENKKMFRGIWYMASTLTPDEAWPASANKRQENTSNYSVNSAIQATAPATS